MKYHFFCIAILSLALPARSQDDITILSRNSAISLRVQTDKAGRVTYGISCKSEQVILPSALGFVLNKPALALDRFENIGIDTSSTDETWEPVWGEVKSIRNSYRQLVYALRDKQGTGIRVNLVFRLLDDGVGFRYEFPKQEQLDHFIVGDELTEFKLTDDHTAFWIPGDYDSNEYLYNTTRLSAVDATAAAKLETDIALKSVYSANAVQTPLSLKTDNGIYVSIHEAALLNYPVMQLDLDKKNLALRSHLVPDVIGNKAYLQTPFKTP